MDGIRYDFFLSIWGSVFSEVEAHRQRAPLIFDFRFRFVIEVFFVIFFVVQEPAIAIANEHALVVGAQALYDKTSAQKIIFTPKG